MASSKSVEKMVDSIVDGDLKAAADAFNAAVEAKREQTWANATKNYAETAFGEDVDEDEDVEETEAEVEVEAEVESGEEDDAAGSDEEEDGPIYPHMGR